MESLKKRVNIPVLYLAPGVEKEAKKEILGFFGKIFKSIKEIEAKDFFSISGEERFSGLLLVDCRGVTKETRERCLDRLEEIKKRKHRVADLLLFDARNPREAVELVRQGAYRLFPVPWDVASIRGILGSLIGELTLSRRFARCRGALKECEEELREEEKVQNVVERVKTLENLYRIKISEMEHEIHEIATTNTLLKHGELKEKARGFLARGDRATMRLQALIDEMKALLRKEGKSKDATRLFNLNTILINSYKLCDALFEAADIELIFEVDRSVPAQVTGNPILLGQVLVKLFEALIEEVETKEIVLYLYMRDGQGGSEKTLHFELRQSGTAQDRSEHLGLLLQKSHKVKEAARWVAQMGGGLTIFRGDEGVLLAFTIPVHSNDRRSYRLPAKGWMQKRMLIVDDHEVSGRALEKMLGYFHFHVERVVGISEALERIYAQDFDVIFLREKLFDSFVKEGRSARGRARLVAICRDIERRKKERIFAQYADAFLPLPFTPQNIFDVLLEVYSSDRLEGELETVEILRENLAFLIGGKRALYIGEEKGDALVIQQLLEGIEMLLLRSSNLSEAAQMIERADIVVLDDRWKSEKMEELLQLCRERCRGKALFALLHGRDPEKIRRLKETGIEELIVAPIDAESFYRQVLERLLESHEF